jgi:lipooligosaccharide transport system permease protein
MSITSSLSPAWRTVAWKWAFYRRVIRANLVSSFGQPLLYLLAMGLGVGTLIDRNDSSTELLGGVSYLAFLAPGLLATTAMTLAVIEGSWPVMDAFQWGRQYQAMAATPIRSRDIVIGHGIWVLIRGLLAGATVALAMVWFDELRSFGLLLAVLAAALCGLAFGMPAAAWAATRTTDVSFPAIQRFVVVPLFLFGGAFYPLSQLPALVRPLGYATPLWHGVELCRGFTLGTLGWLPALGHVVYLLLWCAVGGVLADRYFAKRLYL